ncbi:MAG: Maf family protein [Thermovirgaceae bacterium]
MGSEMKANFGERLPVVLASGSPRRKELLKGLGWFFKTDIPNIDESMHPTEQAEEAVVRLAEEKALMVARRHPESLVIAADTIVRLNGLVIGKPSDRREALEMLSMLNGKTHEVLTGVAVFRDQRRASGYERTLVEFRNLAHEAIEAYLECNDSFDKAGAYGIQERGSLLVKSIRGCYFNVVGLPLSLMSRLLEDLGVPLTEQWRMGI